MLEFVLVMMAQEGYAEPWLAQRFAKNCTACHAPGRVNRDFKDKRFSMSCDSCHENPNGGGLRNYYGKWLEKNWLRSHVVSRWVGNTPPPASIDRQHYAAQYPAEVRPKNAIKAKDALKTKDGGGAGAYPLVRALDVNVDIKNYNKDIDQGHWITAHEKSLFESFIPDPDPYRTEFRNRFQAGGDLRYYMINTKVEDESESESLFTADVGLSFKLLKRPDLKFIFEYRYFSDPNLSIWGTDEDQNGLVRSAYVKMDDMAYDSYVMAGVYRPMFGLYRANYFSLRETMLFSGAEGAHRLVYEGLTLGAQPGGTSLFNVSLLTSLSGTGDESDGYIVNIGGNAPYWGLNFLASFWNSTKNPGGNELSKQMLSLSGGFNIEDRWIGNTEVVFFKEDTGPSMPVRNSGYVAQVDLKRRLWKEYYANFNVGWANTARDLSEGNAVEYGAGLKAYLIPALELELLYMQGTEKHITNLGVAESYDYGSFYVQTHFFW